MVLPRLLTRFSMSQCLLRGQTLRTSCVPVRSCAILTNRDSQILTARNPNLQNQVKFPILPLPVTNVVRYASNKEETESVSDYKKHNHVSIWRFERAISLALVPVFSSALLFPCYPLDLTAACLIVIHTHWGLEAIIVDYIRPIIFGNLAPKIGLALLYLFSAATLAGLYNLITNDVGLANSILHILKS